MHSTRIYLRVIKVVSQLFYCVNIILLIVEILIPIELFYEIVLLISLEYENQFITKFCENELSLTIDCLFKRFLSDNER